jgi:hypothetical protein
MASAETAVYDLPYPTSSDPVNVAGDIQSLAERIEVVLPTIGTSLFSFEVTNNSGTSIAKGDPVFISGFNSTTNKVRVSRSQASDISTFPVVGLAQSAIGNGNDGVVVMVGAFTGINTSTYTIGDVLYVGLSGGLTTTQPITATSNSGVVAVVSKVDINGVIFVGSFKGNGTWGSMKEGLA